MFLKLLGSLIVIFSTTFIGYVYSRVYAERVKQLRDMQYALNMLESEIIYTSTPLIEALSSVGEKSGSIVKKLLINMSDILRNKKCENISDAFFEAAKSVKNDLYFEDEEIELISSFIQSIGSSDLESQKKNFNITVQKLESFEKKADEKRIKNEKLYRYLGLCTGVLIVIILV
jgi:stage III sporulation protein AB